MDRFNVTGHLALNSSRVQAVGTATTGNVRVDALRADRTEAGFVNTYWDMAQLQGRNVSVRAAGNVDLSTVFASASNQLTIESGGHLTTSGNYIRWQVDNRANNGWYQDEHHVARTTLEGTNGVRLGALGGSLTLNATDVRAASGSASLQALQHIRLEAAEEHLLHQGLVRWPGEPASWRRSQLLRGVRSNQQPR